MTDHRTALEAAERTIDTARFALEQFSVGTSTIYGFEDWPGLSAWKADATATLTLVKAALAEEDEVERLQERLREMSLFARDKPVDDVLSNLAAKLVVAHDNGDNLGDTFNAFKQEVLSAFTVLARPYLNRAEAAEARVKELEGEWAVMARACGNWREWPVGSVIEGRDRTDDDWLAGARAILERDEQRVRAEKAEAALATPVAGEVEELAARLHELSMGSFGASTVGDYRPLMHAAAAMLRRIGTPPKLETTREPDYCFNQDEWEYTWPWADRNDVGYDMLVGDVIRVGTLFKGPDKWLACVPLAFDETGSVDESDLRWFDTEAEARAAAARTHMEGRTDG